MQLPGEGELQFDIPANLRRGFEYVGGNLKITNRELYFKPHSFNIQKEELVIPINEIKAIDQAKILGLFPNGVMLELKDNTRYKFTIGMPGSNKKQEFMEYIDHMIS